MMVLILILTLAIGALVDGLALTSTTQLCTTSHGSKSGRFVPTLTNTRTRYHLATARNTFYPAVTVTPAVATATKSAVAVALTASIGGRSVVPFALVMIACWVMIGSATPF